MIYPEKHIELSRLTRGLKSYTWQEAQIKVGHVLADEWLNTRAGSVDFWGVDDWGELMFETFLWRVYESDKNLDDLKDVKWYFNCGTFDIGLPPGFKQKVWTKNLLSYKRIKIPHATWEEQMAYSWSCLQIHDADCQKLDEIYDAIETNDKNVITNADEITEELEALYREILTRPDPKEGR